MEKEKEFLIGEEVNVLAECSEVRSLPKSQILNNFDMCFQDSFGFGTCTGHTSSCSGSLSREHPPFAEHHYDAPQSEKGGLPQSVLSIGQTHLLTSTVVVNLPQATADSPNRRNDLSSRFYKPGESHKNSLCATVFLTSSSFRK